METAIKEQISERQQMEKKLLKVAKPWITSKELRRDAID